MRDGEALAVLERLQPELIVVVAYGKILPKEILYFPKYHSINIHASLLPKYRGSAPIQWSILNGETVTGVTSMLMDEGIDTGDMLLRAETEIPEDMTAGNSTMFWRNSVRRCFPKPLRRFVKIGLIPFPKPAKAITHRCLQRPLPD